MEANALSTAATNVTKNLSHHPLSTQPVAGSYDKGLMWFRRDLRLDDNAALFYALKHCKQVFAVFVFDKTILDELPSRKDRRVDFIWSSISELKSALQKAGGDLYVLHAHAEQALPELAKKLGVQAVFTNKDYEPAAKARDAKVKATLAEHSIELFAYKDQVIFEEDEVLTQSGNMFSVFTPYKNACLKKLDRFYLTAYPSAQKLEKLAKQAAPSMPTLESMGFEATNIRNLIQAGASGAQEALGDFLHRMDRYKQQRDFPAVKGVSYLSVHMRFGTLSIRQAASAAWDRVQATGCEGSMGWFNELIWRDFYFQILDHRPDVVKNAFKPEYDKIQWATGEQARAHFQAWCEGKTGFPLVDAAMRQLNQTGYMHNRLRMVTASFLTKDLGLDWRWGERYFADQLNDFDLSANNGGWQWAASSGCDAQPYFRIFNPYSQSEKFDGEGKFIRKYCPELAKLNNKQIHNPAACTPMELEMAGIKLGEDYPRPVVQHDEARKDTLLRYAVVKKEKG